MKDQVENGRATYILQADGSQEIRRQKGLDPRMLGEAGRGLIRFAEIAGLLEHKGEAANAGEISTNVVFINPSSDGVSWDQQVVHITSSSGVDPVG